MQLFFIGLSFVGIVLSILGIVLLLLRHEVQEKLHKDNLKK